MSARERLDKYLDMELPEERLLFHVSMLLGLGICLFNEFVALFFRMDPTVMLFLLLGAAVTLAAMYAESRTDKTGYIAAAYLVLIYFIMLPWMAWHVPYAICDFPFYYFTGIAFIMVLFEKKQAVFLAAADSVVILISVYYMTLQASESAAAGPVGERSSVILFFRVLFAMFIMVSVYGVLILYRSRILNRQIQKSAEVEHRAEQLSYAKDMFLVNVSHEIRTPLNAILGVTELMLDQDMDERLKENAYQMSRSSKALLSITNELMDFSKLDRGGSVFTDRQYSLGSICDELINMISVRFADYEAGLYADIAPDIPEQLVGDGDVVRQIMMEVLSGVIKSVEIGEVNLKIYKEDAGKDQIRLCVEINARGRFRHSYRQWLYDSVREETDSPDEEEAVPLPCRLVQLMQGEMDMAETGDVRKYSFRVLQGFVRGETLASKPSDPVRVLCYENTDKRSDALVSALRNMKVDYFRAFDDETFFRQCADTDYTHIMIAAELYTELKDELGRRMAPQSLILIGGGMPAYDDALVKTTIDRPVSCLNLDALMNGRQSSTIRYLSYNGGFVCPDADIMVVDDNVVNLEVAASILNRYQAKVSVAASGRECLGLLERRHPVDLILLDYMMPEMDGIDTLKNIRAMDDPAAKTVPVVALTANAVSGAREMFMNAGFDEYISKPIEREKLEKILREWLPSDKVVYIADGDK